MQMAAALPSYRCITVVSLPLAVPSTHGELFCPLNCRQKEGHSQTGVLKTKPGDGTPTPPVQYVPHGNFFKFLIRSD